MASTPDHLTLKEHRDREHRVELAARRVLIGVLTLLCLLALVNVFGQNPAHSIGTGEVATLEVSAPSRLRGGLFYEGEFTIRARQEIESATLLLDRGWFESMHINSYSPEPVGCSRSTTGTSPRGTRSSPGSSSRSTRRISAIARRASSCTTRTCRSRRSSAA